MIPNGRWLNGPVVVLHAGAPVVLALCIGGCSSATTVRPTNVTTTSAMSSTSESRGRSAHDDERTVDTERNSRLARADAFDGLSAFAELRERPGARTVVLEDELLFDDTGALSTAGEARLERVARAVDNAATSGIVVRSHDDIASNSPRSADTRRRAEVVRAYLAARGISPAKLRVEAVGIQEPRMSNASPLGRESNRRIEIVVLDAPRKKVR